MLMNFKNTQHFLHHHFAHNNYLNNKPFYTEQSLSNTITVGPRGERDSHWPVIGSDCIPSLIHKMIVKTDRYYQVKYREISSNKQLLTIVTILPL